MLWPNTTTRDSSGVLHIGGVNLNTLADEFGTPLYVYDEETIRQQCRAYREAFEAVYPNSNVVYAGKAWLSKALLDIIIEEGLSVDVVSAGELFVALTAGVPAEKIAFHGNNKTPEELQYAVEMSVGTIVIDNFDEIDMLQKLTVEHAEPVAVMLRLNPGVDVHTHDYRKTGIVDSKFGLGIQSGAGRLAVQRILGIQNLALKGFHAHIGSQIFEIEPFVSTIDKLFAFAADIEEEFGYVPLEIAPGGGFGIQYEASDPDLDISEIVRQIASATHSAANRFAMEKPILTIEPGRSIVGPAGVAMYTIGSKKEIAGVRTYVSIDGGMADNIRPALYGAVYSAQLISSSGNGRLEPVTIAGKYCESGDVLINDIELPPLTNGDLLAVPAAGAYCLAMSSNYNMALRPAVVFVRDGDARLVQRRETLEDLIARDVTRHTDIGLK